LGVSQPWWSKGLMMGTLVFWTSLKGLSLFLCSWEILACHSSSMCPYLLISITIHYLNNPLPLCLVSALRFAGSLVGDSLTLEWARP